MKLYFENSNGVRRLIAEPSTRDGALEAIRTFCEERNFRIYYTRIWNTVDGECFDVGSHSEFFYLVED